MSTTADKIRAELEASRTDLDRHLDQTLVDEAVRNAAREIDARRQREKDRRWWNIVAGLCYAAAVGIVIVTAVMEGGIAATLAMMAALLVALGAMGNAMAPPEL